MKIAGIVALTQPLQPIEMSLVGSSAQESIARRSEHRLFTAHIAYEQL
jgi:hypothetical protein